MHTGDAIPRVRTDAPLAQALLEMTDKGFGMTTVVDEQGVLVGVYTDGDLRRSVGQGVRLTDTAIGSLMTPNPKDRKSTRLNSSHVAISYAVFCLKKKKKTHRTTARENTVTRKDTG